MKNQKKMFILVFSCFFLVASCNYNDINNEEIVRTEISNNAVRSEPINSTVNDEYISPYDCFTPEMAEVTTIPDGYLCFEEISSEYSDILHVGYGQTGVAIVDIEEDLIDNFSVYSLVQKDGKIYGDGQQINDAIERAKEIIEEKDKVYSLNEEINLTKDRIEARINIAKIEYKDEIDGLAADEDKIYCAISVNFNDVPLNDEWDWREASLYISHVETTEGNKYNEFHMSASYDIFFLIPKGDKVKYIFLTYPRNLDVVRKLEIL